MDHSIIPPSGAHRHGAPGGCTGSVLMQQQFPEIEESQDAKDGTASHEIATLLIHAGARGHKYLPSDIIGQAAINGVIFTDEMFEAAEIYANDIINVMRETAVFGGPQFRIEQRVTAPRIHELSFGTPDASIYDRKKGNLFLWDYKFGFDKVEVFENWQLITYTCGLLEELEINGITDQYIKVHLRIVQPRAFQRDGIVREWIIQASDLRSYFNILHGNAAEALGPNPICRSGSHCKNCSARHACDTALTAGFKLYEVATKPTPIELSPEALGVQYAIVKRAYKQLEYLESGLAEQAKGLIRSGANVPGWMLEQGVGREKWIKPIPEVVALGDMMGHDLRKPADVITPNQARKTGLDGDLVTAYTESPRTGLKLVPDDTNKAKQVFKP